MSATVVKLDQGGGARADSDASSGANFDPRDDARVVYEVQAGHVALSIVFYPGDPEEHERPWRAEIRFVADEQELTGADVNRRAAFLAAVSRHETMVRGGRPLADVAWSDVEAALEEAGAFQRASAASP